MPRIPLKFRQVFDGWTPTEREVRDMIGERELFRTLEPLEQNSEGDETGFFEVGKLPATHDNATAVTSKIEDGMHMPVIDIDLECMLVPSTQAGHFHLYINKPMAWDKYVAMLEAMEDAGVIGPGYLRYSKKRGYSTVRYPGVTKYNERDRIEDGMTEAERDLRDRQQEELARELELDFF